MMSGKLLIPRINPAVIHAINISQVPEKNLCSVLEYYQTTGPIIATDIAVKSTGEAGQMLYKNRRCLLIISNYPIHVLN